MKIKTISLALMLSLGAFADNAVDNANPEEIQQAVVQLLEKNVAKEEAKSSKIADGLARAKAMYDAVVKAFASIDPMTEKTPQHTATIQPVAQPEGTPVPEAKLTNPDL